MLVYLSKLFYCHVFFFYVFSIIVNSYAYSHKNKYKVNYILSFHITPILVDRIFVFIITRHRVRRWLSIFPIIYDTPYKVCGHY